MAENTQFRGMGRGRKGRQGRKIGCGLRLSPDRGHRWRFRLLLLLYRQHRCEQHHDLGSQKQWWRWLQFPSPHNAYLQEQPSCQEACPRLLDRDWDWGWSRFYHEAE